jgi:hypothetical protein
VHISHREHYHSVARSALLTALLGYTFYVPGLLADIGRWYNIWHPTLPNMWQGNSVLFEVGICVMLYLNVQYLEMTPIVCERFLGGNTRLSRWAHRLHHVLERIMPALLVAGVTLSTFHQSSLGNLMVIAPYKLHELWWSPLAPLHFLISAMMAGFPMVIFTLLLASWALKRKPQMNVLGSLALYPTVFDGLPVGLPGLKGGRRDLAGRVRRCSGVCRTGDFVARRDAGGRDSAAGAAFHPARAAKPAAARIGLPGSDPGRGVEPAQHVCAGVLSAIRGKIVLSIDH